ncbi:hypothetical protein JA1_001545 [Spathaspora sp. JA1]|nr:hypothetical protein JA1_001545 [Spathaspora sp. JA1]
MNKQHSLDLSRQGLSNQLVLSEILSLTRKFSFFEELINIPQPPCTLSNRDIFKCGKLLSDIHTYLVELVKILKLVSEASSEYSNNSNVNILDWYFEGKEGVFDLLRNIDSIESILNQLILVFEENNNQIPQDLVASFHQTNEILLDVKKRIILFKRNLDLAINYQEINQGIIKCLITEIEDCIKNIFKLREIKISSPKRNLPKFNLDDIISKMKINDFTSNVSLKSIRLPTFNDLDERLYLEYLELESKINPLKISLNIVPIKIEEFNSMCLGQFKQARQEIFTSYESMDTKWTYLQQQMSLIKHETIDVKWNEIFQYLIEEIEEQCQYIIEEIKCSSLSSSPSTHSSQSSLLTEGIASTYKQCSNTITIITKAFNEGIITQENLVDLFNNNLLPKWKQACDLIQDSNKANRHKSMPISSSSGFKSFQTGSRHSFDGAKVKSEIGGIDIGLDIEPVSVPFSISKPDRVKSFIDSGVTGENLQQKLKDVSKDYNQFNSAAFFNKIISRKCNFQSKIPRIFTNYHELGHPIIEKKINLNCKIPEINFTHPVFNSPERASARTREQYSYSPENVRRGSSSISTLSSTKFSMSLLDKPNLAFEKLATPAKRPVTAGSTNSSRRGLYK